MSRPEPSDIAALRAIAAVRRRYTLFIAIIGLTLFGLFTLHTLLTRSANFGGVAAGTRVPPFATPLANGDVPGEANVATHAHDGAAGRRAACTVRGPGIFNVCELYEHAPLVLALFIDAGGCPAVLADMQRLQASFPGVRFAAVAVGAQRSAVRRLIAQDGLTFPVGVEGEGVLAGLYGLVGCPQLTFVFPGGIAQGHALNERPSSAALRARVATLVAGSRARGWRGQGSGRSERTRERTG